MPAAKINITIIKTPKLIIWVVCLFLSKFLIGQSGELPLTLKGISFGINSKNFDTEIIKIKNDFKILNCIDIQKLDSVNKTLYFLRKSTCHFFLNKDSVDVLIYKSFHFKPKTVCMILLSAENVIKKNKNYKPSEIKYYFDVLEGKLLDSFNFYCNKYKYIIESNYIKTYRDTTILEKKIMGNDQQERVNNEINWTIQNKLDSINRVLVDSAYQQNKSLIYFTQFELDAFTFVLHHSNDLNWVRKWFSIWLNELTIHEGKLKPGMLLRPAFERFQQYPKDKISEQDISQMKAFFIEIKGNYPSLCKQFRIE